MTSSKRDLNPREVCRHLLQARDRQRALAKSSSTDEWVDWPAETSQTTSRADTEPEEKLSARRLQIIAGETPSASTRPYDLTTGSPNVCRSYVLRSIQVAAASRPLYLVHGWYIVRARVYGLSWGEDPQAELAVGVRVVEETSLESLPATGWRVIENWLGWNPPQDPMTPIREHRADLLQDYGAAHFEGTQFDLTLTVRGKTAEMMRAFVMLTAQVHRLDLQAAHESIAPLPMPETTSTSPPGFLLAYSGFHLGDGIPTSLRPRHQAARRGTSRQRRMQQLDSPTWERS